MRGVAAGAALSMLLGAARAGGQVEVRRGGPELPAGCVVMGVDLEGVTVAAPQEGGPARALVLGWQSVREVHGAFAERAEEFRGLADKAWRAYSRLERGDVVMAEPVLEELFPVVAGHGGPTALMVCDGLLKCRLKRGARIGAIEAWLAGVSAREAAGDGRAAWGDGLESLVDSATGLAPTLPPVWLDAAGVQVWAASAPKFEGVAGRLEGLYREAAKSEGGLSASLPAEAGGESGERLVWEMVTARAGSAEARRIARQALGERIAARPGGWEEAWARAGLGRSMLREDSEETRRLGVAELLHVPARLADQSPYLAGVALAEAAVEVRRMGNVDGAWRLRSELLARYPEHPAVQWEALRGWAAPAKTEARPTESKEEEVPDGTEEGGE